jgi:hypothetical protein
MTKELFALLLAGALMVPSIKPAGGEEGTVGLGTPPQADTQAGTWGTPQLAPVPHLDATPWATADTRLNDPKVEILTDLQLDTLGPFLVEPTIPPRRISSSEGAFEE